MKNKKLHALIYLACAGAAVGFADVAAARVIRINFGDAGFSGSGEAWPQNLTNVLDVTNNGSVGGTLPFSLQVSPGTSYDSFCVFENAVISFAAADACNANAADSVVFGLLENNWVTNVDGGVVNDGAMSKSEGYVDRDPPFDSDPPDPLPITAVRFLWNQVHHLDDPSSLLSFQAIFYDLGGGDFDVEFNYDTSGGTPRQFFGNQFITAGGASLYDGGAGAFTRATDYFFSFRGGVFESNVSTPPPPPTGVPEPSSIALLLAGLGAFGWSLRKRRLTLAIA